jgi:hypothetical protein
MVINMGFINAEDFRSISDNEFISMGVSIFIKSLSNSFAINTIISGDVTKSFAIDATPDKFIFKPFG